MAAENRTNLKAYFQTGDKPTQSQFSDLIDSFPLVAEHELKAPKDNPVFSTSSVPTPTNNQFTFDLDDDRLLVISKDSLGNSRTGTISLNDKPLDSCFYLAGAGNLTNSNAGTIGIGPGVLPDCVEVNDSVFIGSESGLVIEEATGVCAIGRLTVSKSVTGGNICAVGDSALRDILTSGSNAYGYVCLNKLSSGVECNAFGRACGDLLVSGSYCNLFGNQTLSVGVLCDRNNVFGHEGAHSTLSHDNCVFGHQGLYNHTEFGGIKVGENAVFGNYSGFTITTGARNTFLGTGAGNTGTEGTQLATAFGSIGIGYGTITTKNYQCVLGPSIITETILRGNVGFGQADPTMLISVGGRSGMNGSGEIFWGSALTGNNRGYLTWDTNVARIISPVHLKLETPLVTVTTKLNLPGLPTSASGLSTGDVWKNGSVLNIV